MKKFITVLFALLLVLSLSACQKGEETTNTDPEPGMLGGWEINKDYVKPLVATEVIDYVESNAEIDGSSINVVALLGTQVVAGTNYLFLGEYTIDKASERSGLVTLLVYADLEGNFSIVNCKKFELEDYVSDNVSLEDEELVGAFEYYIDEDLVIEETPLKKALEQFTGADYESIALLGTQVVAGYNYAYLTYGVRVVPDAKKFIAIVTVYENTNGECSILNVAQLDLAALAE